MPKIEIPLASIEDAEILQSLSIKAFEENYEKYGHYPPGLESVKWHQDKIENDIYHKILYGEELVGGVHLSKHPDQEMKIEYLFINPTYQGKKMGANVMALLEAQYKQTIKWFLFTPYKDFRNHSFYEKLGYKKVGEIQPDGSSAFTLFQYEK